MVIKCPNCNRYISDTVNCCPHCGTSFNAESSQSTKDNVNTSEMLEKLREEIDTDDTNTVYHISTIEGDVLFSLDPWNSVQVIISASKSSGKIRFQEVKNAYQRFKRSSYYSDIDIASEDCNDKDLFFDGVFDFEEKENAIQYLVELLQNVFNITSLNQIQIEKEYLDDDEDSAGILMKILCFFLPIVGFILYFKKKQEYPNTAKSYLMWAAIGIGVPLLINLINTML